MTCSKLSYIRDHIIKTKHLYFYKNIIYIETISLYSMVLKIFHLLSISNWTTRFWSSQWSNQSKFSASPSWRAKYLSPKEIFWFPLHSQDYFVIQIGRLWLDLNTEKWFARPNLSLIKNGRYYHYQWQINYQLRLNMRKCPILGIYFAWLHCKASQIRYWLYLKWW